MDTQVLSTSLSMYQSFRYQSIGCCSWNLFLVFKFSIIKRIFTKWMVFYVSTFLYESCNLNGTEYTWICTTSEDINVDYYPSSWIITWYWRSEHSCFIAFKPRSLFRNSACMAISMLQLFLTSKLYQSILYIPLVRWFDFLMNIALQQKDVVVPLLLHRPLPCENAQLHREATAVKTYQHVIFQ